MQGTPLHIRAATREDCALIATLVRELADYEREPQAAQLTGEDFARDGFGAKPAFECLIGEVDGVPGGLALFFPAYSTWSGTGIYLEDLFVRPQFRGLGLGKALLLEVAKLAVERGAARLNWSVLTWNKPAFAFYDAVGAKRLDDWCGMRLSGSALAAIADPTSQRRDVGHPASEDLLDLAERAERGEVAP